MNSIQPFLTDRLGLKLISGRGVTSNEIIVAELPQRRYRIAVERARLPGAEEIECRIARAWLRLRSNDQAPDGSTPLIVVMVKAFSERTRDRLERFLERHGVRVPWLLTDGERVLALAAVLLPATASWRPDATSSRPRRRTTAARIGLTDKALSCVKALVYAGAPGLRPGGYAISRASPSSSFGAIHSIDDLARSAGTSKAHAYRFVNQYRQLGFVQGGPNELVLVRRTELLQRFADRVVAAEPSLAAIPASASVDAWLQQLPRRMGDLRIAVGAHRAAGLLGIHEVVGAPLTIFVADAFDSVASRLELKLVTASDRQAPIILRHPRFPQALWRGLLDAPKSELPVTDLLQCYVDLLHDPYRGRDLAEAIARATPALFDDPDVEMEP